MAARPRVGLKVLTADGHEIGRVSRVAGDCFKVDIPMWPDHWLDNDSIAEVRDDVLVLDPSKNALGESVRQGIGHLGFHVHPHEDEHHGRA